MRLRHRPLLFAGLAAVACALPVASAAATPNDLAGVWSFKGGRVAIQAKADGSFEGRVVEPTTFSLCTHPAGELMWRNLKAVGDGSYLGTHQWFIADKDKGCIDAGRGATAFRVLDAGDGTRKLRVCFNHPGDPVTPSVAADGTSQDVTFECVDSAYRAAVPTTAATADDTFQLPTAKNQKACASRRRFRIHVRQPRNDNLIKVSVYLGTKRVKVLRGRRVTTVIDLRGLPKGRFTVRLRGITALGHVITQKHVYRTCAPKHAITT